VARFFGYQLFEYLRERVRKEAGFRAISAGFFSLALNARDLVKVRRPWERRAAPDLAVGPEFRALSESADTK